MYYAIAKMLDVDIKNVVYFGRGCVEKGFWQSQVDGLLIVYFFSVSRFTASCEMIFDLAKGMW